MKTKKRILICPLDWGLGHATRCIPVIHELQKHGAEVVIAADKRPLELLKQEFPQLHFIVFPGYDIAYPENGSMVLKMAFSIPKMLRKISEEKKFVKEIVRKEKIDGVISDNRYGLGITDVPTVLMLHQLMIKSPFGESVLHQITLNYVKQFSFCWVPDFPGENNLSGDLSHQYPLPNNARFVGALSRFSALPKDETAEKKYNLLVIISGPEPQRTVFEKMIVQQVSKFPERTLVVLGKPENKEKKERIGNADIISHLNAEQLFNAISASEIVLTRPGYSTIMDLAVMKKKAIFIPTPGQTEQEYLGNLYHQKKLHLCVKQHELNVAKAMEQTSEYSGFSDFSETELLSENVKEFLGSC